MSMPDPTDPSAAPHDVTALLAQWCAGDRAALDALVPLVYQELRRLAAHHMRHDRAERTTPCTGLVHEAYLRLADQKHLDLGCRHQFFGLASTVMRHILVDHARARRAAKRGGGSSVVPLDTANPLLASDALAAPDDAFALIALDEALRQLEQLDAQQVRVVEMRFFAGMSVEDTAAALGLSASTVKREWATARAWLLRAMGQAPAAEAPDADAAVAA
jgi:RNA polymerase sigma factor (TIGR02999 family)